MYGYYQPYIEQRWRELGVPEETARILGKYGNPKQGTINNWINSGDPQGVAIWDELQHAHGTAFHRAVSELYYVHGHHDVGTGEKLSGIRFRDRAEDIIVLRPIDAGGRVVDGPVRLVDAVYALGGADPRVGWDVIGANAERRWTLPLPLSSGPVPVEPPPVPEPAPHPVPLPAPDVTLDVDYRELLDLAIELHAIHGPVVINPEVLMHWAWGMLLEGRTADDVRQDARHRAG